MTVTTRTQRLSPAVPSGRGPGATRLQPPYRTRIAGKMQGNQPGPPGGATVLVPPRPTARYGCLKRVAQLYITEGPNTKWTCAILGILECLAPAATPGNCAAWPRRLNRFPPGMMQRHLVRISHHSVPLLDVRQAVTRDSAPHCFCEAVAHCDPTSGVGEKCGLALKGRHNRFPPNTLYHPFRAHHGLPNLRLRPRALPWAAVSQSFGLNWARA